jgi:hypothetical protein
MFLVMLAMILSADQFRRMLKDDRVKQVQKSIFVKDDDDFADILG